MREGRRAHTCFGPLGLDNGGDPWGGRGERIVGGNQLFPLRCASWVVAVKAESSLYIQLRLGPRPENQTCFRFGQELIDRSRVRGRKVDHGSARQFGGNITRSQAG